MSTGEQISVKLDLIEQKLTQLIQENELLKNTISDKEKLISILELSSDQNINFIERLGKINDDLLFERNQKVTHVNKVSDFEHYFEDLNIKLNSINKLVFEYEQLNKNYDLLMASKDDLNKKYQDLVLENNRKIQELKNLKEIPSTLRWRIANIPYNLILFLFPINSYRFHLLKLIKNALVHPRFFLRIIKEVPLSSYIRIFNKQSLEFVDNRIGNDVNNLVYRTHLDVIDLTENYEKISIPTFNEPIVVSIIIPVYNQFHYTYNAIKSIVDTVTNVSYEIIVGDDGSIDQTKDLGTYFENIAHVKNDVNLGFLKNCNKAASFAKGNYICFLNNDVLVQNEWLTSLVSLLQSSESIGMVGSKLVYPDGRLQEAGGILWKDGSAWNYGRLDDPEKPEYNYVKEVDYISGASIMIRASLWNEIGGFDERYAPAYCEDSDLAFEVRKHGFKVMYQPKSVIVHFEGISNGTDTALGIKKYQLDNKDKFVEKWKSELESNHFDNGTDVFLARDRSKNKKTILVVDHYVPEYDKDAGSRSVYNYLEAFLDLNLNVIFLPDNFNRSEPYTTKLQLLGVHVLYGYQLSTTYLKWIKKNGSYVDFAFINRPHTAIKYIDDLRKYTQAKILYNGADIHHIRLQREYEISKDAAILKEIEKIKPIEDYLYKNSDVLCSVSTYEIDILKNTYPEKRIALLPTYIFKGDLPRGNGNSFENRKDLLFVGGFNHKPNVDGILWFANEIFPLVVKEIPDIKLNIVGSNPTKEILNLTSDNILVHGYVSDEALEDFYNNTRIVVVPLRYGAGVKGKVIEALSYGVPIVSTSIANEGISNYKSILMNSDSLNSFTKSLVRLYNRRLEWELTSKNIANYINSNLSFSSKSSTFNGMFSDIF